MCNRVLFHLFHIFPMRNLLCFKVLNCPVRISVLLISGDLSVRPDRSLALLHKSSKEFSVLNRDFYVPMTPSTVPDAVQAFLCSEREQSMWQYILPSFKNVLIPLKAVIACLHSLHCTLFFSGHLFIYRMSYFASSTVPLATWVNVQVYIISTFLFTNSSKTLMLMLKQVSHWHFCFISVSSAQGMPTGPGDSSL